MKKKTYFVVPRRISAVLLSAAAVLLIFALVSTVRVTVVAVSGKNTGEVSWGLKQHGGEQPPSASPAGAEMLNRYGGRYMGAPDGGAQKRVYFTYDLGYEAGYTARVLDVLKEHNIKSVFFLAGHYAKTEEALVRRMLSEGHYIGNHTNNHKTLTRCSGEEMRADIAELEAICLEKYGKKPAFFRPPGGVFDERVLSTAQGMGYTTLLWSAAYVDWERDKPMGAQKACDKVTSMLHPGAIFLFHIASSDTPEALPMILNVLEKQGYTVGAPEELIIVK